MCFVWYFVVVFFFFFFKQKTAYEMRISDWSSDVCSSDLMVNEGARVLEEGIAQRASDIDVTFVFGYGFPKYRGGPMFWAESQGLGRVLETVRKIHAEQGDRWKPAALLETCAQAGNGWRR